jgi:hypothetical protein
MPVRMRLELHGRGFDSRRLHHVGAVAQLVEHVFRRTLSYRQERWGKRRVK